ncbi:MAG: methionyl-tRNA formyltransferase [Candidatus Atribacteria bacterium]|nr:methionyl-tRNA formyltransferase [Candidatus Atribacteria bacterium]
MKIIFIGTSSFGIPVLKKLLLLNEQIITVISQPDRPSGRGKIIQATPVKEIAIANGLKILQPENINDERIIQTIKELKPDLMILIAFGQILNKNILDIPTLGCINVHPSLLPKYRGPAPIQWAIIRGEKETGISILFLNEKIDSGDIILQKKVNIFPEENFQELHQRLSLESAEMIEMVLEKIKTGNYQKIIQSQEDQFYARKLTKIDCRVQWEKSSVDIYNLIRGLSPNPGAYTEFRERTIKIIKASLNKENVTDYSPRDGKPGSLVHASKDGLYALSGDYHQVIIQRLVVSGSKEMDASQFINGYRIKKGDFFN